VFLLTEAPFITSKKVGWEVIVPLIVGLDRTQTSQTYQYHLSNLSLERHILNDFVNVSLTRDKAAMK
jgi:hypothetical protein